MATDQLSQYLPAIFQQDPFVGRFLLAVEKILSGFKEADEEDPFPTQRGLEQILDGIHFYFDPRPEESTAQRTPAEFLNWLAGWVALTLREDWEEDAKRRFISRIVPIYRKRGTKAGLKEVLEVYTQEEVKIYESAHTPHYFQVEMTLGQQNRDVLRRKEKIALAIIDQEKPAHTF